MPPYNWNFFNNFALISTSKMLLRMLLFEWNVLIYSHLANMRCGLM